VMVWGTLLIVIIIKPSGIFGASRIGKGKL